jgi:hypothetical protein
MFFSANQHRHGWSFVSDPGWSQFGSVWAKGYAHDMTLEQVVRCYDFDQPPNITGNFCLVKIDSAGIDLGHNRDRNFPLWANQHHVSNINPVGQQIWADTRLNGTKINIPGALEQTLTLDQATDKIIQLVLAQSQGFLKHTQLPINIFRSGGLDTAFVYALIQYLAVDAVEWTHDLVETNDFIENNKSALDQFWAYKQIHHWNHPCAIVTGSHGDEYFLRGPTAIAMIMAWHDIDFVKILDQNPDAYHYWYFSKPANRDIFASHYASKDQLKEQYPTWISLADQIVNILANDHQHWHLGQTLTWTPQKDLDIARWALCLPIDDLVQNSLHGTLIRNCIKRLLPSVLDSVTKYKNHTINKENCVF